MPIYKGNEFIERIGKGQDQLRRVYKGNNLVYGLFDINYHDRGSLYEPINEEISKFAWGKRRNLAPGLNNDHFKDHFDEYKLHWYGWYDDTDLNKERSKYNDNYIVTPDDTRDLNLYAKWKQKKFSYTSEQYNHETIVIDSEGHLSFNSLYDIFGAKGKIPVSYVKNSDGTFRKGWHGGVASSTEPSLYRQCTWWSFGRTWEICGEPENGLPGVFRKNSNWGWVNGGQIFNVTNWQKAGGAGKEGTDLSNAIRPGDIITWSWNSSLGFDASYGGPGHVAVVEKVTDDKIYYSEAGTGITTVSNPARMNSRSKSQFVVGKYLYSTSYESGSYNVHFQGVIYNPYISHDSSLYSLDYDLYTTSGEIDCADQDNPSVPGTSGGTGRSDMSLPDVGTYWADINPDWFAENGGWYWRERGKRGQCVWGANGRSAQLRNNVGAGAPWGDGVTDYSGTSVGPNAEVWMESCKGHWSPTTNWSEVQVGDVIVYDIAPEYPDKGGHVVVVEEVLGNGSFLVSSWNHSGTHDSLCYGGTFTETSLPGERSSNSRFRYRPVLGYVINHTDPVVNQDGSHVNGDPAIYTYITSERTFDYNTNDWSEWTVVDTSDLDWNFDWGE